MTDAPAPAVFFGHGSPMNALGGPYRAAWREVGEASPKPKAVLMVSAHWYVPEVAVTAMERPPTIHDFGGFPPALHAVQYPAPGAPWLGERVARLLDGAAAVRQAHDWGLDHGAWSVLMHAFPEADVPVVQLSVDRRLSATEHYAIGRRLSVLRDEGVMIAASGDVVHNLSLMRRDGVNTPYDWAAAFNEEVKAAVRSGDHAPLIQWETLGEAARLSAPTDEHWLPLMYVLAAQRPTDRVELFNDAIDAGSISMLGVAFGLSRPLAG